MKLKPISLLVLAVLSTFSAYAAAIEPITVRDIRVEGLQRTELGTVFNYLPVKVGGRFDDAMAREAVKALFATGFFNDVRIEADGDVLIVMVEERPTIAQININGAEVLEKDMIRNALKSQNFAEGRIFQQDILDAAIIELKQQYFTRGRYAVNIKPVITKLERNRIGIQLDIDEGDVARIKRINVVGNKAYGENDILNEFSLSDSGWMTWYTKADQYSKQKLTADLEKLRSLYQDSGYLDFNVDSTQVSISENKKEIYLTVNITEGEKFTLGDFHFSGDLVVPEPNLRKLAELKTGDIYSREKIVRANASIAEQFGKEGYAFANINPVPEVDRTKNIVNFTFYVDPGRKTFVRRVNINGNTMTRDEVLRREVRQMEAAPYDGAKIKRSKQRLEQLNYFKEVNIETPVVPDAVDQVDLNVTVAEKKTGSFNVGVGYGQSEGMVLTAALSQANFFGSGKSLTLEANTSKSNTTYALSVMNPYATPDGASFGWSVFTRKSDPSSISLGSYNTTSQGAGVSMGLPVTDENRVNVSMNAENLVLNTNTGSPKYVLDFVGQHGNNNHIYTAGIGWARDTRDSAFYPMDGNLHRINMEVEVPGSTTKFFKLNSDNQIFYSFFKNLTALWNVEAGYALAYGGSEVPFYRNYFAGGIGSVRGYQSGSLSPKDDLGSSMGGTRRLVNNFEFLTPIPGMKIDKSMRLSAFVDSGNAWAEDDRISFKDLHHSTGVAFTWISPVGPLKISYALPINQKDTDKIERFQLMLGQVF